MTKKLIPYAGKEQPKFVRPKPLPIKQSPAEALQDYILQRIVEINQELVELYGQKAALERLLRKETKRD